LKLATFPSFASLSSLSVSIYGGVVLKERYLEREFEKVPEDRDLVHQRAIRARIVQ
jgi:hypothetical protein